MKAKAAQAPRASTQVLTPSAEAKRAASGFQKTIVAAAMTARRAGNAAIEMIFLARPGTVIG